MLAPDQRKLEAARERRKRHLARAKAGLIVLNVLADEHRFAEALLKANRVAEQEALDRKVLEAEAAELIRSGISSELTESVGRKCPFFQRWCMSWLWMAYARPWSIDSGPGNGYTSQIR